jgi:hypothetical protein
MMRKPRSQEPVTSTISRTEQVWSISKIYSAGLHRRDGTAIKPRKSSGNMPMSARQFGVGSIVKRKIVKLLQIAEIELQEPVRQGRCAG